MRNKWKRMIFVLVTLGVSPAIIPQASAQQIHLDKYKAVPQTLNRVRIASASILPEKWNKEINWQRIEKLVRKAGLEGKANVVVTPEGALEGYVINEVNAAEGANARKEIVRKFKDLAEPIDGPYIQKACLLSKELEIYLVLGFLEKRENNLFNTAILIDPEGDIVGRYSKTHFYQGYKINPPCYIPGNTYPVFNTPFGKVGILICYDRQLPEPARILALKGARILFVPSYGSYDDGTGWNTNLLRTRAYENRFPLVFTHPKQSLLITHRGELERIGGENEVVYYEVDTSLKHYERRFRLRRPSTYRILCEDSDI